MAVQRLDKVLSNSGFGSRKEIRQFMKYGVVKVNDKVVKDGSVHVDVEKDIIEVNGEKLQYKQYTYIMINKPDGVLSATEDSRCKTVLDLLGPEYSHLELFPVGRLDKDTEGLLLLTNDGQLAHKLLSPKKHIPKKYFAKVEGVVNKTDVDIFQQGVILEDNYKALPGELNILDSGDISIIELVIYEGKFHQVKRMFKAVGKTVIYLKRLSMGNLKLDEKLELGQYRELTDDEVEGLYNLFK